jgi:hypothetical protein
VADVDGGQWSGVTFFRGNQARHSAPALGLRDYRRTDGGEIVAYGFRTSTPPGAVLGVRPCLAAPAPSIISFYTPREVPISAASSSRWRASPLCAMAAPAKAVRGQKAFKTPLSPRSGDGHSPECSPRFHTRDHRNSPPVNQPRGGVYRAQDRNFPRREPHRHELVAPTFPRPTGRQRHRQ